tara:strand:- start:91 stop:477 length:387 start_codon:yes stop_codon:yes gene_type:complete
MIFNKKDDLKIEKIMSPKARKKDLNRKTLLKPEGMDVYAMKSPPILVYDHDEAYRKQQKSINDSKRQNQRISKMYGGEMKKKKMMYGGEMKKKKMMYGGMAKKKMMKGGRTMYSAGGDASVMPKATPN